MTHNGWCVFDAAIVARSLHTGISEMRAEQPDLNDKTDQWIVRLFKGNLKQEIIVRLANGFPTTDREADLFDEKKARNDKRYEEYIRKMIKVRGGCWSALCCCVLTEPLVVRQCVDKRSRARS
jgi:hypothetical protein